jgi:2-polyprenyl-6-methoxyphenol hydroxylase-like FAD-dependent oxidoreductase
MAMSIISQPDGSIMGYFGNAFFHNRGNGQRGNLRIPRKVLRRILLDRLEVTKLYWNHRLVDYSNSETEESFYTIDFEEANGKIITVNADLIVAADGIRSSVVQKIYRMQRQVNPKQSTSSPLKKVTSTSNNNDNGSENVEMDEEKSLPSHLDPASIGLRHTGIRLILGIADFSHPLLDERGFYTLDGMHRLFTMPYESNRYNPTKTNRVMWQLSFSTDDENRGSLDSESLRAQVLKRCQSWHEPVLSMVQATPIETIWGTDLMDRDPNELLQLLHKHPRIVVLGDALHSMTPFKGQGANQALQDGPLLADWLQRGSVDSAVKGLMREAVQRTAPIVQASRLAARELHSPMAFELPQSFAGVRTHYVPGFLSTLKERAIGARLGAELDYTIGAVIKELDVGAIEPILVVSEAQQSSALRFAMTGDTRGLRELSLQKHSESIRTARDSKYRTCLHLAALAGHSATCKWLLTELEFDKGPLDQEGKSPLDNAFEYCDASTVAIFKSAMLKRR